LENIDPELGVVVDDEDDGGAAAAADDDGSFEPNIELPVALPNAGKVFGASTEDDGV